MVESGLRKGVVAVVTDENVAQLYLEDVETAFERHGWTPRATVLPAGEATKSVEHLGRLHDAILSSGIDRGTPLVALGGGVIGDLAGYAAATALRGIPLVQVPTTLIAQVDSSIGGKTGINHKVGKNLIGAFYQPALVLTDAALLASLPDREWHSGLAEVVKHALIADADYAQWLVEHWREIEQREDAAVRELVPRAAAVKVKIVSEDVFERGRRAILNFGHTFGHAIERTAGYGAFTHGEAVAVGMRAALHLSSQLFPQADFTLASELVRRIPVEPAPAGLSTEHLMSAMQYDKKVDAGKLRVICLRELGAADICTDVDADAIRSAWEFAKTR